MLYHEFKFRPSKQYASLLLAMLLATTVVVLFIPLSFWLKPVLLLLLYFYSGYLFWRFGLLRGKKTILSMTLQSDGHWYICVGNKQYVAELRGDSTVTGFISVLRFNLFGSFWPRSCVVFADSLEPHYYRQLLVLLRMG